MALTVPVNGTLNAAGKPAAGIQQNVSYTTNGFSNDVTQTQFPLQLGVPIQNLYTFNVMPAEVNDYCIAQAQTPTNTSGGSFYATLNTSDTYSLVSAYINTVSRTARYNGSNAVQFDCERCLTLNFFQSNGTTATVTDVATTVVVQALDYRGVPMTIAAYLAAGASSFSFGNPVSTVLSVQFSNTPFTGSKTFSLGNNSTIGLPYVCRRTVQIVNAAWLGAPLRNLTYADQGDFVGMSLGDAWRQLTTSELSNPNYMSGLNSNANTGFMGNPARGTVALDINGSDYEATGSATFSMTYFVYGSDSEINANIQNLNESALAMWDITGVTSASASTTSYAWPYLVQGDLTGYQWSMPTLTATNIPTTGALSALSGDVPALALYAATLTQLAV